MSSGSSQPTQQNVTTTTSNLPDYAQPYYENVVNRAQALSYQPYTPYPDQRTAGFTPEQQQVQQSVAGLTGEQGLFDYANKAAVTAGVAGNQMGNYAPADTTAQQIGLPSLTNYSMNAPQQVQGQQINDYQMGLPSLVSAPQLNSPTMAANSMSGVPGLTASTFNAPSTASVGNVSGGATVTAPGITAAQTGYNPQLTAYQMADPGTFGQTQAQQYMSPYMQDVIDASKTQEVLDAKKAQLAQNLGAARQGTYGGARELINTTQNQKNLQTLMANTQVQGLQSAYENAQQQYERDRQAGLYTGTQNLNSKLGVQQLGTQTGLQTSLANLTAQQQANVQNAANQLQASGMSADNALRAALGNQSTALGLAGINVNAGLQTNALNANQQLQTGLANQSAGLQVGMANLNAQQQTAVQNMAAQLQTQGLNAQDAMQAALANQNMGYNVGVQNLGSLNTAQGLRSDQAMRADLANQQAGLTTGQANLNSANQTQQLGAQTGMQALLANQNANLAAQQQAEQSRQFGANLGLQGNAQTLQSSALLGQLAGQQQTSDLQRLQAQEVVGQQQQQQQQAIYDQQYADFLNQQNYPAAQLGTYSNILHGLPVTSNITTTNYAAPPSAAAQTLGTGLGGLSMRK